MDDRAKADEAKNLILGLHEEVTELGRIAANYKRHMLRSPSPDKGNVTGELADCMKYIVTLAQLYGITPAELKEEFHNKSAVVLDRANAERHRLTRDTKVLCVDIDDCIADLSEWPKHLSELKGGVPRSHHKLLEEHKDDFHSSGRFRDLPLIEGAKEGLQEAREMGFTIVLITARPQHQYKRIYSDTLHWLDKHEIPRDLLLFDKDKVDAIHRNLAPAWPVAFVEDHPRNALALASAGVQVLLYHQEHNKDVPEGPSIKRVRDWAEIVRVLKK